MVILIAAITILNIFILIIAIALLIRNPQDNARRLEKDLQNLLQNMDRIERSMRQEIAQNRQELTDIARQGREESAQQSKSINDSLLSRMAEIARLQKDQLDIFSKQLESLTNVNEQKLEKMRDTIENRIQLLQGENSKKLNEIRQTVDEKLHATLEKRLGESFKLVSDRLEQVHKGLGEMHTLAAGVGDLKKVLANVKTRGAWGEIQLGNLLEQLLTKDQYSANVATKKGSSDRVEYAIKLPGRDTRNPVWLPIDAKFPFEDYQRLLECQEAGDINSIKELEASLEDNIKMQAKKIREKYIDPPHTTDFALMFLPIEGLYAEVLRRPGLCESLQREYRIIPTGPTTISAILNSLQMGFRTLTIEKHASEVWQVLGAIKTEFGRFGDMLEKTHEKLQQASNTLEDASRKSRTIEKKLQNIQELPSTETAKLIQQD